MDINLRTSDGREIVLSTEHAASSYGIPVAVVGGAVLGSLDVMPRPENDQLPWLPDESAGMAVVCAKAREIREDGRVFSSEELEMLEAFARPALNEQ